MTAWQLTIDCTDPSPLVAFWSVALGYEPLPPPKGFATWRDWYISVGVPAEELGDGDCADRIRDPAGVRPSIWFQIVPEHKTVKNRLHLDIDVTDGRSEPMASRRPVVEQRAAELIAAGGRVLYRNDGDYEEHYGVTMADPEGNEFCVS